MTSNRSIVRKGVAVATTVVLTAFGISLGASAANATTSASSVVSSVLSTINADHTTNGSDHDAFASNGFVTQYAALANAAEVTAKGATNAPLPDPADTLQPYYNDLAEYSYVASGSLSSSSAKAIAAAFDSPSNAIASDYSTDNYAGVAVTTSGGKIYAELVVAFYSATPLDRIVASAPTISGTLDVGKTLTAKQTVTTTGTTETWQWYVGDEPVGTDADTYTPVSTDYGQAVSVTSTLSKDGYLYESLSSANTKDLGEGTITGHTPTISGHVNANQELSANTSASWGPGDVELSYYWYVSGKVVSDGTDYEPSTSEEGKSLKVEIIGTEDNFRTETKSSASYTIGYPFLTSTPSVSISGTTTVGQVLTATATGDWGPGTVKTAWQWKVNGKSVSGATKSTFTIPSSAYSSSGSTIQVFETGTEKDYAATTVSATDPDPVAGLTFEVNGSPNYSGAAVAGKTITAVSPTFSPKPTTIKYNWSVGGVTKSTSSSYKIPSSAPSETITLTITVSKSGYVTDTVGDDDIAVTGAP